MARAEKFLRNLVQIGVAWGILVAFSKLILSKDQRSANIKLQELKKCYA